MAKVAVIDYGMGNLRSVSKALASVGADAIVTDDPDEIWQAERVILPGVGAMRDCVNALERLGLVEVLQDVFNTKPILGICLGLQVLFEQSEENNGARGLGFLPGTVKYFDKQMTQAEEVIKVPHMGWNRVKQVDPQHPLWRDIPQDSYFYFVHSYYAAPQDNSIVAGMTEHGLPFTAAIAQDNLFATQFHPEKSQKLGLQLLANFLSWNVPL